MHAVAASATEEPEALRLIDETLRADSRLDILVNLAGGVYAREPAIEFSLEDWTRELNNNLLTAFLVTRGAFPHMAKAGAGSIVNFARAGGPQANMVAYNCAKAGVEALTRTFALEGRDAGIRVNAIAPGLVDTQSNVAAMKPKDMKRWAKRDDIAEAVVFARLSRIPRHHGAADRGTGWESDGGEASGRLAGDAPDVLGEDAPQPTWRPQP